MSPKSATIISLLALLSLSLTTLTLSSATHTDCPGFESASDILYHYDLPRGIFPNDVQHFKCDPVVNKDAHTLSIRLHGVCNVTRELLGYGVIVAYKPQILATISYHHLTHVKGVTFIVTYKGQPMSKPLTITEATVFSDPWIKYLLLKSQQGINSPLLLVALLDKPPTCDRSVDDNSGSASVVAAKDDNQDVPIWVYKFGRLLHFVAA